MIFKTLQSGPTNWTVLKGLLTYRTIQFSMSSGCCHPKNLFWLPGVTTGYQELPNHYPRQRRRPFRAVATQLRSPDIHLAPQNGDKKSESRFKQFNSAT